MKTPAHRRPIRTLGRWLRFLVLILAVAGLAPVAEAFDAVEIVVGTHEDVVATDGCGADCADGCERSRCHAGVHHCGCCAPAPRVAPDAPFGLPAWEGSAAWTLAQSRAPPSNVVGPPRQPPRA